MTGIAISSLGEVSASGTDVPSAFVDSFEIGGEFTSETHADLTYLLQLSSGGEAPGTITLDLIPEPAALSTLLVGVAALGPRRRRQGR